MATQNAVGNGLSGSTGTGSFVGSISPTLITPTLGVATATSLTFSPTTNGIIGTPTNNNAGTGTVGEFISSIILSTSAVAYTTGTPRDITSISLTAGDWEIFGNATAAFLGNPTSSILVCWVSSTSATSPEASLSNALALGLSTVTPTLRLDAPFVRASLASTTTYFLSAQANFTGGTTSGYGAIYARRIR